MNSKTPFGELEFRRLENSGEYHEWFPLWREAINEGWFDSGYIHLSARDLWGVRDTFAVFVALLAGPALRQTSTPVGFETVQFARNPEGSQYAYRGIFVHPEFRGQGVGRELFRHVEGFLQTQLEAGRIGLVRAKTSVKNDAYRHLMDEFSYEVVGRVDGGARFFGEVTDALVLERKI
ncbi:MAG: GNAT family N-acetyltransferase [Promethearchaeota archaeon]